MVNKIPIFIPKHYDPFILPELNAEQKEIYNKLSEYVNTILLPVEDSQYQVEREWVSEKCLKRYCRSANWNLVDAKNRMKNSLEWRRVYKPNDIDPKELEPEAITGKIHINGFDKQGRPIIYLRPGLENTKAGPRQVKNVVFTFEAAIKIMPKDVESVVIVVDFHNCSPRSSPGLGIAKEFMYVLGSHYPERLSMALIINAPWYFWGFFKLISPFIDPVTKNKIKFVDLNITDNIDSVNNVTTEKNSSQQKVRILDYVDKDQLESEYGGDNYFDFEFETYWKALLEKIGKNIEEDNEKDI